MRVVVLTVDEHDLLGAPGDEQVSLDHHAQIAGAQPALRGEGAGIGRSVFEVAPSHVVAADQNVSDRTLGHLAVIVAAELHLAVGDGAAHRHQLHRVARAGSGTLYGLARAEVVTIELRGTQRRAGCRKGRRQGGFRQAVHRVHGVAGQLRGLHSRQELLAQLRGNGFGTVEDQPHGRQIQAVHGSIAEYLQVMPVAEVRRAQDGGALAVGEGHPQQRTAHEQLSGHQVLV